MKEKDFKEWQEVRKKRRFKLSSINTRATFLEVLPQAQELSKNLLTVATFVFAGSMTFLGLRTTVVGLELLKFSWIALGASLVAHIFGSIAMLDARVSHSHTELSNERAAEMLREKRDIKKFALMALESHADQDDFFKSARYLTIFLIIQAAATIVGIGLIATFTWQNL